MRAPSGIDPGRRQFLVGGTALAGAVLVGACGSGSSSATSGTSSTTASPDTLALAQFFGGPMFVPGRPQRAPFGVADADGLLPVSRTPERLEVQLVGPDGTDVGDAVVVERRHEGLPRAYFPLLVTVDSPGIYTARTEIAGASAEMQLQVHDPADVKVIQPGTALPALETPTTAAPRGVSPVCTREPACPLHDVTVADALAEGAPIALLVASPAFCQIAICGPVLEVLLEARTELPDVRFIHAEVYAEPARDLDTYAPVVAPLGLHFEPCLVLVGANGKVVDRIDTIYDRSELHERLASLT